MPTAVYYIIVVVLRPALNAIINKCVWVCSVIVSCTPYQHYQTYLFLSVLTTVAEGIMMLE